ncbi:nuclear envelope integral membrane protein 1 [Thrips palmi]|uniref:Nuclear envelope integral membrane protein 1 n=1 Tax=Thrips palmi TaxID=161013 RepID=A0A6P8YID5_THRPL|nr:nuclear envelope integral membrane protein 1 [Thrips palmi]
MFWPKLFLFICSLVLAKCATGKENVRDGALNLIPGETLRCCDSLRARELQTYCYSGRPKHILHIWQTVLLKIQTTSDNFEIYDGGSPEAVQAAYEQHQSSWSFNLIWGARKGREVKLSPFNRSCIGISSSKDYSVYLHVIRVDYWRVLLLVCGLILFLSAPRLCENTLFYYINGVSIGMLASFLILIYMISRLLPRKPMMYGFVFGGWAVVVYLFQMLWDNLRIVLVDYRLYVLSYVAITGFLSFIVCYRFGPVTDKRSINLIKWSLQGISMIIILCSSQFQEATVAIVLILVALYNFPKVLVSKAVSQWKRRFPPKVELLSDDQYHEQGVRETQKALDELRGYCSSPDCNQWKTVLRLKDPVRFASFVEGKSHLVDREVLDYETATPRELDYSEDSELDLTD